VVPEVLHGGQVAADAVVDHAAVPTLLEPMLGTNESIIYGGKLKSMFKTFQCSKLYDIQTGVNVMNQLFTYVGNLIGFIF
jgi:hypothetical protein